MKLSPQQIIWMIFKPHIDRHNIKSAPCIYLLIINKDEKVNVLYWGYKLIEMEISKDLDIIYTNLWNGIPKPPHEYTFNLRDPEFENKVGELIRECLKGSHKMDEVTGPQQRRDKT